MVTPKMVRDFLEKWSFNNPPKNEDKSRFVQMLQSKYIVACEENKKIFVYDGPRSKEEIEEMMVIADDLII